MIRPHKSFLNVLYYRYGGMRPEADALSWNRDIFGLLQRPRPTIRKIAMLIPTPGEDSAERRQGEPELCSAVYRLDMLCLL